MLSTSTSHCFVQFPILSCLLASSHSHQFSFHISCLSLRHNGDLIVTVTTGNLLSLLSDVNVLNRFTLLHLDNKPVTFWTQNTFFISGKILNKSCTHHVFFLFPEAYSIWLNYQPIASRQQRYTAVKKEINNSLEWESASKRLTVTYIHNIAKLN